MTELFPSFLLQCAPHGSRKPLQGPDRAAKDPQRDAQFARGLRSRGAPRGRVPPGAHHGGAVRARGAVARPEWSRAGDSRRSGAVRAGGGAAELGGRGGGSGLEGALRVGAVLFVLVVELLNSAVEATVDRISFDNHRLAKRAKDIGSAAVMLSITTAAAVWLLVLLR